MFLALSKCFPNLFRYNCLLTDLVRWFAIYGIARDAWAFFNSSDPLWLTPSPHLTNLPNGSLRSPGFGSAAAAMVHPGKDNGRLFHDQIILYGGDPVDAACDLPRFIDGLLRINEAAQLNHPLVSFDTDLEWLEKIIICKQGFYLIPINVDTGSLQLSKNKLFKLPRSGFVHLAKIRLFQKVSV